MLVIGLYNDPLDPHIEKGSRGCVLTVVFRFAGPFSPDGKTALSRSLMLVADPVFSEAVSVKRERLFEGQ